MYRAIATNMQAGRPSVNTRPDLGIGIMQGIIPMAFPLLMVDMAANQPRVRRLATAINR